MVSITGHAANTAAYGIPVPWDGSFSAYLRPYTLSYDLNGGSDGLPAEVTQHTGTIAAVAQGSALSRTGYAFLGWNTAADGNGTDFSEGETITFLEDDVQLYAKWSPIDYTVDYNANGGTGATAPSSHTYGVPKALTSSGFTRAGCTFAGWASDMNGPTVYRDGQSVLNLTAEPGGAVTLYAKWKANSTWEPIPSPIPAPTSISMGTVVNCRSGVNVRRGPGTNYPILDFAPRGAAYTVIEKTGAWYKVELGGRMGYIAARYLTVSALDSGQGMVVNCKHSVNVRSGPGARYSVIRSAPRGAVYTVIGKSGGWYKIEWSGRIGYISADYLSVWNG